jgi:stress-induced morphogen
MGLRCGLGNITALRKFPAMPNRAQRIRTALEGQFQPHRLEVLDESHQHAGHAGARPEGETHYSVLLVSPAFTGMKRVDRSRAVHAALAGEFARGLHALALTLRAPDEVG